MTRATSSNLAVALRSDQRRPRPRHQDLSRGSDLQSPDATVSELVFDYRFVDWNATDSHETVEMRPAAVTPIRWSSPPGQHRHLAELRVGHHLTRNVLSRHRRLPHHIRIRIEGSDLKAEHVRRLCPGGDHPRRRPKADPDPFFVSIGEFGLHDSEYVIAVARVHETEQTAGHASTEEKVD